MSSFSEKLQKARFLRKRLTPQERLLWEHLRANRFFGVKFKRQVVIGKYIVDFCSTSKKMIIELDGGLHRDYEARAYDQERDDFLESEGYTVLRFWNSEVDKEIESVFERIQNVLSSSLPARH